MNYEGCEKKWSWPDFKIISRNVPGGTEKNHKNLGQKSRFLGRGLKPGLSEYEAGLDHDVR
jgi:hypothetical protein